MTCKNVIGLQIRQVVRVLIFRFVVCGGLDAILEADVSRPQPGDFNCHEARDLFHVAMRRITICQQSRQSVGVCVQLPKFYLDPDVDFCNAQLPYQQLPGHVLDIR